MVRAGERVALPSFLASALLAGGNAVGIRFSNRELAPLLGAGLRFAAVAGTLLALAEIAVMSSASLRGAVPLLSVLATLGSVLVVDGTVEGDGGPQCTRRLAAIRPGGDHQRPGDATGAIGSVRPERVRRVASDSRLVGWWMSGLGRSPRRLW